MKFVFDGIVDDRPVISLQLVWRVSDDVAPDWPTGDSRWLLHIDGDPIVDSEFVMATEEDARTGGVAVGRHAVPQRGPDGGVGRAAGCSTTSPSRSTAGATSTDASPRVE